ncbi:non-ribosomal peptide synthetase/type I polyketide synthase [Silanimonas sp.]|uniref:non-ribosomal peptide synthetase/type I polyketide synthase n=1 Tax=Silanimonas sp. TaxID=1929290 RepID=UPI0022BD3178|nr:non-ribosomal peptide synthetase/type I polyketide synthase [Silanimonas sp.]MCZ8113536.1 amino acid adenylation domain-containing protein [Silanimonas sp.]
MPPLSPSALQDLIARTWTGLLGEAAPDARANLFDAGAHSLLVPKFIAAMRQAGVETLGVADVYDRPTIAGLTERALRGRDDGATPSMNASPGAQVAGALGRDRAAGGFAIVGMALRGPGAPDLDAFWNQLLAGQEGIRRFRPDELDPDVPASLRSHPNFVAARGVVEDLDRFDAGFFGVSAREATLVDPQQRMLLELSWQAFEHAAIAPERASRVGVYAGTANNQYTPLLRQHAPQLVAQSGEFTTMLGAEKDFVATRIAHRLDLKGPAMTVLTACSTGLVVVAQACEALAAGHCDAALAAASTVLLPQAGGYLHVEGGMESADGRCRPFDAEATGTVFSNGGAVVLLKRLEDALADGDTVYAVIQGVGLNNDGGGKASFTAPSVSGQSDAIRRALDAAGVSARDIGYVEAHGTATTLGDPIEVSGLVDAYRRDTRDTGYCWLGSVKGNVGHTWAAAGLFGLIKSALVLHHGVIPRSLHFRQANPQIEFARTPFRVCTENVAWPRGAAPRHAAVSSFGVGGTNVHLVLGEAPACATRTATGSNDAGWQVLPISARSEVAVAARAAALAKRLDADNAPDLADVAYTLIRGRSLLPCRAAVAARDRSDAIAKLRRIARGETALDAPRLVFLFPGQGAQSPGMARELHAALPEFARAFDDACAAMAPHLDLDLRALLLAEPGSPHAATLDETRYAQPALFCVSVALARWLQHFGLEPQALIGHSIGELAAAHMAGVLDLDAAATLVCARAAAMWQQPRGAMLAVRASEASIRASLPNGIEIAGLNAPEITVVSGPALDIATYRKHLESTGVEATALRVSHGFHSASMDGALAAIDAAAATLPHQAPRIPLYSGVTGALHDTRAVLPAYWSQQVRKPVRFSEAVRAELERPDTVFVEVGPGQALAALLRQHRDASNPSPRVIALQPPAGKTADAGTAVQGLGQLWSIGAPVAWPQPHGRPRLVLPGYPFADTRFWFPRSAASTAARLAAPADTISTGALEALPSPRSTMEPAVADRLPALRAEITRLVAEVCGQSAADVHADAPLMELGLDSLSATQASLEIERVFGQKLRFRRLMEDLDTVEKLARHFDATLPAGRFAPAPNAPSATVTPATLVAAPAAIPAFGALPPASGNDALNALIQQQLVLMQQQLAVMSGVAVAAAAPTQPATLTPPSPPAMQPASQAATASSPTSPVDAAPDLIAKPFGASARITLAPQLDMTPAQRTWLADFTARYLARYGKSREFSQANRAQMADPRVVTGFNPLWKDLVFPIVADRSEGARVWDIEGNAFIDLLSCFGANLLGYKPQAITQAMHEQLDRGIEVGPQHPLAADVSALLREFSCHERIGLCNTGSEAVMGAMRVARTVTGRKTIAIFSNSYHGIFDEVLVRGTKQLRSLAAAPGILAEAVENILVLDYGSEESLRVLRERAHELAAIMIEPVQNKYPTLRPREFVHELRRICDEGGCALILDEVVTGFRLAPGGAQQFYGVRADLCAYGKIIGGGLPMAAIAGSARWMDALDGGWWQFGDDSYPEAGVTYFAGTYVRHPLALAAAKATLQYLKDRGPALYDELNGRTQGMVDRLNAGFAARGAPVKAVHCASLWRLQWDEDQRYVSLFYYLARLHGLHLYEQFGHFVTEPMGAAEIDRIVEVFHAAIDELMALGFLTPRGGPLPPDSGHRHALVASSELAPLSPGQDERWLAASFDRHALKALNETLCLRLDGVLDIDAFKAAIEALVARHPVFRLRFEADAPKQREVPGIEPTLAVRDLSAQSDPEAALAAFAREAGQHAFALGDGPMIALTLLRLGPARHALHLVYSHLAVDGWAISVFLEELAMLYAAKRTGVAANLPPAGEPSAFAIAERARMESPEGRESAEFWKSRLASPPAPLELGDRVPSGARHFAADTAYLRIDGPRFAALRSLAKARRVTLFQLLLSVVGTLLGRRAGSDDFVLSIPYASQGLGRHPALMSDGVLDLPLRLRLSRRDDTLANLAPVRSALMDALEHPLMTQGLAARLLGLPSRGDRPPLTGVYFNLNPKVVLDAFQPLVARMQEGRKPGLLGELMFNFYEEDDALALDLHHSTEFFSPIRIAEILGGLEAEIDALANVSRPERIERGVAEQARRTPSAIAISTAEGRISFAELDARANRIAHALATRGVRAGDWVGLCLPRGIDLVAALLGVLKAGAAYVPLDPAFPLQRLRDMAEDAGLALLLSDAENASRLDIAGLRTLLLDTDASAVAAASAEAPDVTVPADAPAYVIYTSGSTGKPKGVVVLHRGVMNFLRSMAHTPGLRAGERLLAVTTLSFDIAVLELLLPLSVGAEIVLAQRTDAIDGHALKQLITQHGVRVMQATPSTWHLLLEAGFAAAPGFRALCGGEALSPALARRMLDAGVAELWNMYGPTETTVWSTLARITDPEHITVGRPIDATVIRLIDEQGRECGVGEPGEICIGGAGVAQGYHARPELTAERFIADPFDASPGARLYRTGDLGTWNTDGTIRHMGRLDHQVKLRGYRIELGEIEAAIEQLPGVARAAMTVESFGPMDDRLVAYVAAAADASVPALTPMRRALGQRLPDYMLPQVLRVLDALPLLPNGKIDRKALRPDAVAAAEAPPTAPTVAATLATPSLDSLEAGIGEAMGRLLQRAPLASDEHFFEQGGHSLLAAELAGELQRLTGSRPSLRAIFEAPTPRRLAAQLSLAVAGGNAAATAAIPPLVRRMGQGAAALSVQQMRAWFLERSSDDGSINLLPSAHRLKGAFNAAAFQRALAALVARQSALRTVFRPSPDGAEQVVLERIDLDCPLIDWSARPREGIDAALYQAVADMQAEAIDLAVGPPFRAALFRLGPEEHVFAFVVHHLVWDGWSFDLLYRDMAALYAAELSADAERPAPLALDYSDYAEWQKSVLASGALQPQIDFWKHHLLPAPAPLALPTDHARPAQMSGRGASVRLVLPADVVERLHAKARERGTTLFVLLLAAYTALLQRLGGQHDMVVGTPVRGREQAELLPVMGFFVNALPLRFRGDATSFEDWIRHVGAVATEALGHPDVPIEALVRELQLPRDPSRPALFQAMFSFQDVRERPSHWGPLEHSRFGVPVTGASHELSLWCVETRVGLETIFTFAADLFSRERITAWAEDYLATLRTFAGTTNANMALLQGIWNELLGTSDVGVDDNFFERGGHSLLALSMVSRVELACGKRLPLLRVGDSSLGALAAMLDEEPTSVPAAAPAAPQGKLGGWLRKLVGQTGA